jgi:hypothetical protein
MNSLNQINGVEQICLARSGSTAAHVHARDCTFAAKEDRTACKGRIVLRVTHFDAGYICDGACPRKSHGSGFHLFEDASQLLELFPFFLKEVDGNVIEFNMIGRFAVGFLGFPNQVILGLCECLGVRFGIIVCHVILLQKFIGLFSMVKIRLLSLIAHAGSAKACG